MGSGIQRQALNCSRPRFDAGWILEAWWIDVRFYWRKYGTSAAPRPPTAAQYTQECRIRRWLKQDGRHKPYNVIDSIRLDQAWFPIGWFCLVIRRGRTGTESQSRRLFSRALLTVIGLTRPKFVWIANAWMKYSSRNKYLHWLRGLPKLLCKMPRGVTRFQRYQLGKIMALEIPY